MARWLKTDATHKVEGDRTVALHADDGRLDPGEYTIWLETDDLTRLAGGDGLALASQRLPLSQPQAVFLIRRVADIIVPPSSFYAITGEIVADALRHRSVLVLRPGPGHLSALAAGYALRYGPIALPLDALDISITIAARQM